MKTCLHVNENVNVIGNEIVYENVHVNVNENGNVNIIAVVGNLKS